MSECSICCQMYTATWRKSISCCHCQQQACSICVKKHLTTTFEDAHCMFCKYPWSREFIDSVLSPYFRQKDYRIHRENVLCDREKAKLPETQAILETVKEREDDLSKEIADLSATRETLARELAQVTRTYKDDIDNVTRLLTEKRRKMLALYKILDGETDDLPDDVTFKDDTLRKVRTLKFQCGQDLCKGMLDSDFTCNICGTNVCTKCHELLPSSSSSSSLEPHKCSEKVLMNLHLLRLDSRNCPGCQVMIFKIDGCDQMWCTQCRTAFSWNTGAKISSGQIHNPHFHEWRKGSLRSEQDLENFKFGKDGRDGGKDAKDPKDAKEDIVSCIKKNIAFAAGISMKDVPQVIWDIYSDILEKENLKTFPVSKEDEKLDPTRALRIEYLTGRISETEWKKQLQKEEKKQMKKFESQQIQDMYLSTVSRILAQIVHEKKDRIAIRDHLQELLSALEYVCKEQAGINARYGSTVKKDPLQDNAKKLALFIDSFPTRSLFKDKTVK
jgi:hypothetical protein